MGFIKGIKMATKKFDYQEIVKIKKGSWKGYSGKVIGWIAGKYRIKFSGRGRVTTVISFYPSEMAKI